MRKGRLIWVGVVGLVVVLAIGLVACQGTAEETAVEAPAVEVPPAPFPLAKVGGIGLRNVGVGSMVSLEGKSKDAHDNEITVWSWEITGPRETEVTLDSSSSQNIEFTADTEGQYIVKTTATTEEGETLISTLTINAGTYVGVEDCALCHSGAVMPDMVSAWHETGHATKFEDQFASYSAKSPYCIPCHTTGYALEADNGGFDDLAEAAGWDSDAENIGAWVANQGLDGVKASAAGALINIQCETCHGPGSVHTGTKSYDAGVCKQCHGQPEQWEVSGHAEGEHVGSNYMHTAEGSSCAYCHTGQGYVQHTIRGEELVYPDEATAEEPANMFLPGDQPGITCSACHDPHSFTYPEGGKSKQLRVEGEVEIPAGVTIDAGLSATCLNCHANKRDVKYKADWIAGEKTRAVHDNPQADNFYGVGFYDYDGDLTVSNSIHTTLVEEGCVECHMARTPGLDSHDPNYDAEQPGHNKVGEHTFTMSVVEDGVEVENVGVFKDDGTYLGGACMTEGCHAEGSITNFNRTAFGDYDGDGAIEGVQDEVQGLLDLLAAELPEENDEGNYKDVSITDAEYKALWNYLLVRNDGSLGIHNTAFAVQLLQKTYKQLTGSDVPGATLR